MKRLLYSVEGNAQRLDGGAMFGNAPRALWERWAAADARDRIALASRCLLVREPQRWILFEAGIGASFEPQQRDRLGVVGERHELLEGLEALGLSHADIDVVVLSSLQAESAGGLLAAWRAGRAPSLLFPAATFVASEPAWARARRPHLRDQAQFIPALPDLLEASGRLERVPRGGQSAALGQAYRLHVTDGHTPGLMTAELPGSLGPVLLAAALVPGRAWVHRSITTGFDRFPELLIDEKVALLEDLAGRGGRLFFTRDPDCAMARVTRDERGRFGSVSDTRRLSGVVA